MRGNAPVESRLPDLELRHQRPISAGIMPCAGCKFTWNDIMNALKKLEKCLIGKSCNHENNFFGRLVETLCLKGKLDMAELYDLPYDDFKLAMAIMQDWRLDQYTKTKDRLRELVLLPQVD